VCKLADVDDNEGAEDGALEDEEDDEAASRASGSTSSLGNVVTTAGVEA
jgi:hypothetical protein